jgi:hypothetical protein
MTHSPQAIVEPALAITALRDAGYKGTANAVAELVDNSIEAKAKRIRILTKEECVPVNTRHVNRVTALAVYDDGVGMNLELLSKCLGFGFGTRTQSRAGIGRFGFGLKGASISQARRVSIYSWQSDMPTYSTYLDLDEIERNGQTHLHAPQLREIPSPWSDYLKHHEIESESGTLVIWENCDRLSIKKSETLFRHMKSDLCRIYRHFLDDDDAYGTKIDLRVDNVTDRDNEPETLLPNDPLYLLAPNFCPGYERIATNERIDEFDIDIEYEPAKFSPIKFVISVAKPEIQALGGSTALGKHYAKNSGISFVRAGREIDFGDFGFIGDFQSDPRNRWWGIEVRFEPVLDELFGVEATKQRARNVGILTADQREEFEDLTTYDDQEAYLLKLKDRLEKHIKTQIKTAMSTIRSRGGSTRSEKTDNSDKLRTQVNADLEKDRTNTKSQEHASALTAEEIKDELADVIKKDDSSLSSDEVNSETHKIKENKVDLRLDDWPGDLFLDKKVAGATSFAILNRRHPFFQKFYEHLENETDQLGYEALQVVLMSFVRMEDELFNQIDDRDFEKIRTKWGNLIARLIDFAGN